MLNTDAIRRLGNVTFSMLHYSFLFFLFLSSSFPSAWSLMSSLYNSLSFTVVISMHPIVQWLGDIGVNATTLHLCQNASVLSLQF